MRELSLLLHSASVQLECKIIGCTSAEEAWSTLKKHFERETLANKLFLKKTYLRCEMKHGANMDSHLKWMKELTDQLATVGSPIADEDQIVTLSGSLPRAYNTTVTALES